MEKIAHSIANSLSDMISGYLPPAITAAAVLAAVLFAMHAIYAYKKGVNSKDALKKSAPAVFSASALLFYITVLYYAAVISRLCLPEHDPFSNPYGGWLIEDMTFYYDFSAVLNIFMFIPLCLFLRWFLKYALKKKHTSKSLLILCGGAGFLLSAGIELSQILLKAGTFQFADLFYNTLGAVIGVPVCLVLIKIAQKARYAVKKTNRS